jgi:hypothetical protein
LLARCLLARCLLPPPLPPFSSTLRSSPTLAAAALGRECRAWQKPWGFSGFSKTQKQNRAKQLKQEHSVMEALRLAAAAEPSTAAAAAAVRPAQ